MIAARRTPANAGSVMLTARRREDAGLSKHKHRLTTDNARHREYDQIQQYIQNEGKAGLRVWE